MLSELLAQHDREHYYLWKDRDLFDLTVEEFYERQDALMLEYEQNVVQYFQSLSWEEQITFGVMIAKIEDLSHYFDAEQLTAIRLLK